MNVLVDTNVVLDFLLDRQPFAVAATELFARIERRELKGTLGATTITTLAYLAEKAVGRKQAKQQISMLLTLFEIAPVTGDVLRRALAGKGPDFEDAVLYEAGRGVGVEAIVTRNSEDFRDGELPVLSPEECLAALKD